MPMFWNNMTDRLFFHHLFGNNCLLTDTHKQKGTVFPVFWNKTALYLTFKRKKVLQC
jgi:hypothetical protein